MRTWRGSMLAALAATLARPAWWSMALAGFLLRGGILVVALPLVTLPSLAAVTAALSPTISALAFGGITPGLVIAVAAIVATVLVVAAALGLAGAWLDLAQLRESALDEELELGWTPSHPSLVAAFSVRLAAHLPTLAAAAYATIRLVGATYDELFTPGDGGVPLVVRVVERAPEAVVVVVVLWLVGEAVGAQATRHLAAGATMGSALARATRQVVRGRGLATLVLTSAVVAAALAPMLLVTGGSWRQLRDELFDARDPLLVEAALLVLVSAWILGLAVVGAALAFRTAAWTAEVLPAPRAEPEGVPMVVQA